MASGPGASIFYKFENAEAAVGPRLFADVFYMQKKNARDLCVPRKLRGRLPTGSA